MEIYYIHYKSCPHRNSKCLRWDTTLDRWMCGWVVESPPLCLVPHCNYIIMTAISCESFSWNFYKTDNQSLQIQSLLIKTDFIKSLGLSLKLWEKEVHFPLSCKFDRLTRVSWWKICARAIYATHVSTSSWLQYLCVYFESSALIVSELHDVVCFTILRKMLEKRNLNCSCTA